MPNPIYNATGYAQGDYENTRFDEDFQTESEAIAAVEKAGEGRVVKFARQYNFPGALPEIVCNSIWMKVYENGKWRKPNIH